MPSASVPRNTLLFIYVIQILITIYGYNTMKNSIIRI